MTRLLLPRLGGFLVLSFLLLAPAPSWAQEGQPFTLEQIEGLLEAGLSTTIILEMARPDCLAFRVDQAAAERLTGAGADSDLVQGLRGLCYRGPEPEVQPPPEEVAPTPGSSFPPLYSPTSAAMRSLAVPGLGQFYTGRPAMGVAFLAAWAGAIGFGIMSQEVTVECLALTSDTCPAGQVRAELVERPMLPVGLGAALAVAVISAFEARSGANRANTREAAFTSSRLNSGVVLDLLPRPERTRAQGLVLLQLRHR